MGPLVGYDPTPTNPKALRQDRRLNTPGHRSGHYGWLALAIVGSAVASVLISHSRAPGGWAWFTLVPLLLAIRVSQPIAALGWGAFWGASQLLCSWLAHPHLLATTQTLAALIAVPAVYAWLGVWSVRRIGFHPLVLAVGWMLAELIVATCGWNRGIVDDLDPQGATISAMIARHFGYVLVSFVWAWLDSALIETAVCLIRVAGGSSLVHRGALRTTTIGIQHEIAPERSLERLLWARAPPSCQPTLLVF